MLGCRSREDAPAGEGPRRRTARRGTHSSAGSCHTRRRAGAARPLAPQPGRDSARPRPRPLQRATHARPHPRCRLPRGLAGASRRGAVRLVASPALPAGRRPRPLPPRVRQPHRLQRRPAQALPTRPGHAARAHPAACLSSPRWRTGRGGSTPRSQAAVLGSGWLLLTAHRRAGPPPRQASRPTADDSRTWEAARSRALWQAQPALPQQQRPRAVLHCPFAVRLKELPHLLGLPAHVRRRLRARPAQAGCLAARRAAQGRARSQDLTTPAPACPAAAVEPRSLPPPRLQAQSNAWLQGRPQRPRQAALR